MMDVAVLILCALGIPILVQIVMLAGKQARRHKEVMERLRRIEESLGR